MKIGVLSDTHNVFDRRIIRLFAGVDHILHAGDIGLPWIVLELEQIAPVTAVLGNNDHGLDFPPLAVREFGSRQFLIQHIVNPHAPAPALRLQLFRHSPEVVVFGHTHKTFASVIGRTLFFNPGSAGPARFGGERSVGLLHCDESGVRTELLAL